MCFGKTKTFKSLREQCTSSNESELGFNLDNRCDYIDHDEIQEMKPCKSSLVILQLNCRGIKSKLDEIEELLAQLKQPDVVILSETWLKEGEEKYVDIKGYYYEGVNREHKRGGGVGILVKDKLIYKTRPDLNKNCQHNSYEHFFIELKGSSYNVIIGSLYLPPNTDIDKFLAEYNDTLERISLEKNKEVILGMDHNLDLLKQISHKKTQTFVENTLDHMLLPVITKPTRISRTSTTLIDNVIISDKLQSNYTSNILLSNLSDHLLCYVEINEFYAGKREATKIKKRKLNNDNLNKIKRDIGSIQWESILCGLCASESFATVHNKIIEIIDKIALEHEVYIRNKRVNKHWISKSIANSIRKSKQLFKKSLTDPNYQIKYNNYLKCLNKIKRAAKLSYYQQKCIDYKQNTKKLWGLINKINKKTVDKSTLITKIKKDNIIYQSGSGVINILVKYFATIGKTYAEKIKQPLTTLKEYLKKIPINSNSMYLSPTCKNEISNSIGQLPNKKSHGYDKINNCLLKELHLVITLPLTIAFNKSLEEGIFPDCMKDADTVPLYKSKFKSDYNNYRPISLLITLSKLLEKIVYKRTIAFLDKHDILFSSQYGFRKKDSCSDALMELVSEILKNNDNGIYTACVFLDLSKAFDTLDPVILLEKMQNYGIRGKANSWFTSYLSNRRLRVRCGTDEDLEMSYSSSYDVEYGTPQGSCLGPLLFLIFTNDLYRNLENCHAILFADDTTIYKGHRNRNYLRWCIETDLNKLTDWFQANKLTVNISKTVFMSFGTKNEKLESIELSGETIHHSKHTKFLGLWIDEKLNWSQHCNYLITKLKRNLALVRNTKNLFNQTTLKLIYHAHIQSHINYRLVLWGGMINNEMLNRLQRIQTKCLKYINKRISQPHELKLLSVKQLVQLEHAKLGYRLQNKLLPRKIIQIIATDSCNKSLEKTHRYHTRNKNKLNLPKINNKNYRDSFLYQANKQIMLLPKIESSKLSYHTFIKTVKLTLLDATT